MLGAFFLSTYPCGAISELHSACALQQVSWSSASVHVHVAQAMAAELFLSWKFSLQVNVLHRPDWAQQVR
jgi:hypothetical protein